MFAAWGSVDLFKGRFFRWYLQRCPAAKLLQGAVQPALLDDAELDRKEHARRQQVGLEVPCPPEQGEVGLETGREAAQRVLDQRGVGSRRLPYRLSASLPLSVARRLRAGSTSSPCSAARTPTRLRGCGC